MQRFEIFLARDIPGHEILRVWRGDDVQDGPITPQQFNRACFAHTARIELPYAYQTIHAITIGENHFAVSLETADVYAKAEYGLTRVGNLFELAGYPDLAETPATEMACHIHLELGHQALAREALLSITPQSVIDTCFSDRGSLPLFLTHESLVRLIVRTLSLIGERQVDPSTGEVISVECKATVKEVFPVIERYLDTAIEDPTVVPLKKRF